MVEKRNIKKNVEENISRYVNEILKVSNSGIVSKAKDYENEKGMVNPRNFRVLISGPASSHGYGLLAEDRKTKLEYMYFPKNKNLPQPTVSIDKLNFHSGIRDFLAKKKLKRKDLSNEEIVYIFDEFCEKQLENSKLKVDDIENSTSLKKRKKKSTDNPELDVPAKNTRSNKRKKKNLNIISKEDDIFIAELSYSEPFIPTILPEIICGEDIELPDVSEEILKDNSITTQEQTEGIKEEIENTADKIIVKNTFADFTYPPLNSSLFQGFQRKYPDYFDTNTNNFYIFRLRNMDVEEYKDMRRQCNLLLHPDKMGDKNDFQNFNKAKNFFEKEFCNGEVTNEKIEKYVEISDNIETLTNAEFLKDLYMKMC